MTLTEPAYQMGSAELGVLRLGQNLHLWTVQRTWQLHAAQLSFTDQVTKQA